MDEGDLITILPPPVTPESPMTPDEDIVTEVKSSEPIELPYTGFDLDQLLAAAVSLIVVGGAGLVWARQTSEQSAG